MCPRAIPTYIPGLADGGTGYLSTGTRHVEQAMELCSGRTVTKVFAFGTLHGAGRVTEQAMSSGRSRNSCIDSTLCVSIIIHRGLFDV